MSRGDGYGMKLREKDLYTYLDDTTHAGIWMNSSLNNYCASTSQYAWLISKMYKYLDVLWGHIRRAGFADLVTQFPIVLVLNFSYSTIYLVD